MRRQVPALGTDPAYGVCGHAPCFVTAAIAVIRKLGSTVHGCGPGVKAAIDVAVGGVVVVAPAGRIRGIVVIDKGTPV